MEKTKSKFFSSLRRIKILLGYQISQKYKFASSTKKIIVDLLLKTGIAFLIVFALQKVMNYFNFVTGFEFNQYFLAFIIFIFFIISLISSYSGITSQLFSSTDNELLFSMPVKSEEVFISKLMLVIFNEIRSSVFIFLPILIGFGVGANSCMFGTNFNVSFNYYIIMILMCFIIPLISIALAILISIPLTLYKNAIKNKTSFVVINFATILIFMFLLFNFLVTVIINTMNFFTQINVLAQKFGSFLHNFAEKTVIFKFSANIFNGNYLHLLLLLLVASVLFIVAYFVIKPLYFKMVLGQTSGVKKVTKQKKQKVNTPQTSIFKKDISMLFENGGDFSKYFILAIILPFILILVNRIFSVNDISLKGMYLMISTNILIISMFSCMNCSYVASALTMEGPNFYIFQTTPVSAKKQLISKFLINFLVNLFIIFVCGIIIGLNNKITLKYILLIIFVCSLENFGHLCYSLRCELANPMIDWYDKSEVNSHKNSSRCTTRGLLLGIIFGIFAFKFYLIEPKRAWFELIILALVFAVYQLVLLLKRKTYLLKQINK